VRNNHTVWFLAFFAEYCQFPFLEVDLAYLQLADFSDSQTQKRLVFEKESKLVVWHAS
jgi:hypothetical protein